MDEATKKLTTIDEYGEIVYDYTPDENTLVLTYTMDNKMRKATYTRQNQGESSFSQKECDYIWNKA
ncbi:MAG: hypothetical protein IPG07_21290 [Crocinitomicaceae bacterium]|nr:hypothetical protein [Crocinitomicaceae bacterium]